MAIMQYQFRHIHENYNAIHFDMPEYLYSQLTLQGYRWEGFGISKKHLDTIIVNPRTGHVTFVGFTQQRGYSGDVIKYRRDSLEGEWIEIKELNNRYGSRILKSIDTSKRYKISNNCAKPISDFMVLKQRG